MLGQLIGDRGGGEGWIMVKLNYMQTRQSAEYKKTLNLKAYASVMMKLDSVLKNVSPCVSESPCSRMIGVASFQTITCPSVGIVTVNWQKKA